MNTLNASPQTAHRPLLMMTALAAMAMTLMAAPSAEARRPRPEPPPPTMRAAADLDVRHPMSIQRAAQVGQHAALAPDGGVYLAEMASARRGRRGRGLHRGHHRRGRAMRPAVTRMDAAGRPIWQAIVEDRHAERIDQVVAHPERNLVVAVGPLSQRARHSGLFVAAFDGAGHALWSTRLSAREIGGYPELVDVQISRRGSVIVAGNALAGPVSPFVDDHRMHQGADLFVARVNRRGEVRWVETLGVQNGQGRRANKRRRGFDRLEAVAVDPSGRLHLTGVSTGDPVTGQRYEGRVRFDLMMSRKGQVLDTRITHHQPGQRVLDLDFDDRGRMVRLSRIDERVMAPHAEQVGRGGGVDLLLERLSRNGRVLSAVRLGSPLDEQGGQMALGPRGRVVVATSTPGRREPVRLTVFNAHGRVVHRARMGRSGDRAGAVLVDAELGRVLITGGAPDRQEGFVMSEPLPGRVARHHGPPRARDPQPRPWPRGRVAMR